MTKPGNGLSRPAGEPLKCGDAQHVARSASTIAVKRGSADKRKRLVINHFSATGVRQVMAYPIGFHGLAPWASAT